MREYKKKDSMISAIIFSAIMIAIFVANQLIASTILIRFRTYTQGMILMVSGVLSFIVYSFILAVKQKKSKRRGRQFVGFETVSKGDRRDSIILIVGGYGFMILWLFILSALYEYVDFIKDMFGSYGQVEKVLFEGDKIILLYGSILGPIVEELLFRGLVQGRLRQAMKPKAAILISALAFGVIHLNTIQGVYATIIGLFFGIIYEKTNSLWFPIIGHIAVNSIAQLTSYFELTTLMLVVGVVSIVFMIPAIGIAKRWYRVIGREVVESDSGELEN